VKQTSLVFDEARELVASGKRVEADHARALLDRSIPLGAIGQLADMMRRRRHGRRAYWIPNFHLNLTNICANACKFCSFRKSKGDEGAYTLSVDEAVRLAEQAVRAGAREIHIVNALNPELGLDYYESVLSSLRERFPDVTLKGFTAVEIDYFAKLEHLDYGTILERLWNAGLRYIPGGGAEIFDPRVRVKLGTSKVSGEKWLAIHRLAHERGFISNATMLYGHFETPDDIVDHLQKLRTLQDETGGFEAFIPLKFIPYKTEIPIQESSADYDLRVTAVARIFLDNIPHIKAYWVTLGTDVAQAALSFGADDLDGTIMKERIIHAAGAEVDEGLSPAELTALIERAGFEAVERDSFYRAANAADEKRTGERA